MIKVAISGADNPNAGELIRILVNHPDVDIISISASGKEGLRASALHHGLTGETSLTCSSKPNLGDADILFICEPGLTPEHLPEYSNDKLKTIAFNPNETIAGADKDAVLAVPEMNRKPLVRGAKAATLASPAASVALVALYPLAMNMLLGPDLMLTLHAPEDVTAGRALDRSLREISQGLAEAQKSFNGKIEFRTHNIDENRGMILETTIPCQIGLEDILGMYEIYDDHNFTFVVMSDADIADAVGTDKCIISLSKPDASTLHIRAVADCRMRGAAGEAVHVMNLMFGLHEKTGLALKASLFKPASQPDGLFFG